MLTKSDKKFLKANFATKDDLKKLASKRDIARVETAIAGLKNDIGDIANALGAIFEWTDDIHRAIVGRPLKRPSQN